MAKIDFSDLERQAQFWDRPPEVIHRANKRPLIRDSRLRASIRELTHRAKEYTKSLESVLKSVTEEERTLIMLLRPPDRLRWPRMSESERQEALDDGLAYHIALLGLEAVMTLDGALRHLSTLWKAMHSDTGKVGKLQKARERWISIFTRAVPTYKGLKDWTQGAILLREYEEARGKVETIKTGRERSSRAYRDRLQEAFPDADKQLVSAMARALQDARTDKQREHLHAIVAERISKHSDDVTQRLSGSTLREKLAEARKVRTLRNSIEKGYSRYMNWALLKTPRYSSLLSNPGK